MALNLFVPFVLFCLVGEKTMLLNVIFETMFANWDKDGNLTNGFLDKGIGCGEFGFQSVVQMTWIESMK